MPLLKGTKNVQVKIPSVQSNEANDDDKIILIDNETQENTVITKKDFLYPLQEKKNADDTDFFIGIQPNGSLFRITKLDLLAGLTVDDSNQDDIPLDPTFPRFVFEPQSSSEFTFEYSVYTFEPHNNSRFNIDYPVYQFDNQNEISLKLNHPIYQFDNQSEISLKPNYPVYQFEEQKR